MNNTEGNDLILISDSDSEDENTENIPKYVVDKNPARKSNVKSLRKNVRPGKEVIKTISERVKEANRGRVQLIQGTDSEVCYTNNFEDETSDNVGFLEVVKGFIEDLGKTDAGPFKRQTGSAKRQSECVAFHSSVDFNQNNISSKHSIDQELNVVRKQKYNPELGFENVDTDSVIKEECETATVNISRTVTVPFQMDLTHTDGGRLTYESGVNIYTKEEQSEVLQYVHTHNIVEASKQFDIPVSTIYGWQRKKKFSQNDSVQGKSVRSGKGLYKGKGVLYFKMMERKIVRWILEQKSQGKCVNGPQIRSYALSLLKKSFPSFKATSGWLKAFLKRNNLSLVSGSTGAQRPAVYSNDQQMRDESLQETECELANSRSSCLTERDENSITCSGGKRVRNVKVRLRSHGKYRKRWNTQKDRKVCQGHGETEVTDRAARAVVNKDSELATTKKNARREEMQKGRKGRGISYGKKKVEKKILEWVIKQGQAGNELTGESIRNYALSLVRDKLPTFQASVGWLNGFLKRNKLTMHVANE